MPISIHGKEYVTVNERLKQFRAERPEWAIVVEVITITENDAVMVAKILNENDRVMSTGHAQESRKTGRINATSYVENCETSAIGRALGILGYGIDNSIATAEEVTGAIEQQKAQKPSIDLVLSTLDKASSHQAVLDAYARAKAYDWTTEESSIIHIAQQENLRRFENV